VTSAATGVVALAASKKDAGIPCHQMDSRAVKKVVRGLGFIILDFSNGFFFRVLDQI
jgi:hypothetical protein